MKGKSNKPKQPTSQDGDQVDISVEQLQGQIADLTEALQRERADSTNIRRHHQAQLAELKSTVTVSVVKDLLPVIDNFDRALGHVPEELKDNDYLKGVNSIAKQFQKSLSDMGVSRIETVGQPFDPNLHEAVSVEDGEGQEEIVSEELQTGYRLNDQVIRHAMVKVKRS